MASSSAASRLGDSLSRAVKPTLWGTEGSKSATIPLCNDDNGDLYSLVVSAGGELIYRRWVKETSGNIDIWRK
jgi:hypothetical protein